MKIMYRSLTYISFFLLLFTNSFALPTISLDKLSNFFCQDIVTFTPVITGLAGNTSVVFKLDDKDIGTVSSAPFRLSYNTALTTNGLHKLTATLVQSDTTVIDTTWIFVWNTEKVSPNASKATVSGKKRVGSMGTDAPMAYVTQGATKYFYTSHATANVNYAWTRYKGTLDAPFAQKNWARPGYTVLNAVKPTTGPYDHYWLVNTYQEKNEVLGFVHVEQKPDAAGSTYYKGRIALAYSSDYGNTWKYLGYFLIPKFETESGNPLGAPYYVKDGFIYVYYGESVENGAGTQRKYTTVARANLGSVMAAARLGKNVQWKKYYNGTWESPGIRGAASGIIPISEGHNHTDAAYSTHTEKMYLLTTQSANLSSNAPSKIKLFESVDGVHWTLLKTVDSQPAQSTPGYNGFHYLNIVNADGTDSGIVGKTFYIYGFLFPGTNNIYPVFRWTIDLEEKTITPPDPPVPTDSTDHLAAQEFSSVQGTNGWYYKYKKTAGYINMTWNAAKTRWEGTEEFSLIDNGSLHPGKTESVVRVWRANITSSVNLVGRVLDGNAKCGNGVVARVYKNNLLLWDKTIINGNATGIAYNLNVSVVPGDFIYHQVLSNGDNTCDSTSWNPHVIIPKTSSRTITGLDSIPNENTDETDVEDVVDTPDDTNTEPTEANPSSVAHIAAREFLSTQGANNWFYKYRINKKYYNMTWDAANSRWKGTDLYSLIDNASAHPGRWESVARVWKAPTSGKVRLAGSVFDGNAKCGNGVVVKIFKNDTPVWGKIIANGSSTPVNYSIVTSVTAGDLIYHVTFSNGDNGCDSTGWNPRVVVLKSPTNATTTAQTLPAVNTNTATTTASSTPALPSITQTAGQDFSSTQGNKNWTYQYKKGTSFINMVWDAAQTRWKGSETYSLIDTASMHPGKTESVVRIWTSNIQRDMTLIGKVFDGNATCGNGVIAKIYKNTELLWERTITNGNSAGVEYSLNTAVVSGDKIYHEVLANGDNSCDSTGWNPTIKTR